MNVYRKITLCVFLIVAVSIVTESNYATADDKPSLKCPFRGEVIRAQDYDAVILYRGGDRSRRETVNPYTPLYSGDVLIVVGNQRVIIRDTPEVQKRRVVTAADGEIKIAEYKTCELSPRIGKIILGVGQTLIDAISGPVMPEARSTVPGDRSGSPDSDRLQFDMIGDQRIAADSKRLTLFWKGPDARLKMTEPNQRSILFDVNSTGRPFVTAEIPNRLVAGTAYELNLSAKSDALRIDVHAVDSRELPTPSGVTSVSDLSVDESVLYAIWLAYKGPPEWRLQGYSLLAEAAEEDYMAWKAWRHLISEKPRK